MVANFWFCSLTGRHFRNGKINLLTGLGQEFFWLSLMLNGHPHSQIMFSEIEIPPWKNASRLPYCNERNVTTSKGKKSSITISECYWDFIQVIFYCSIFHQWPRSNRLGICSGHSFKHCELHQVLWYIS